MGNLLRRKDAPSLNALRRSPFGLLGASTRDGKREIGSLAEEKSLTLDADECAKARQDLTNPRTRLSCEIAWLPGLSPKRANEYCGLLDRDLSAFFEAAQSERALVGANLLSAGIEVLGADASNSIWANVILKLGQFAGEVDSANVLRTLNEDRKIAGFSEVQSEEIVASDFSERMRVYKDVVRDALNRMDTSQMLDVVHRVVDSATKSGVHQAPVLIDDFMDSYALDARPFLEKEAANVSKLVEAVKNAAPQGGAPIKTLLDKLGKVVANWSRVAHPVQMSMKSRGMVHDLSRDVGFEIRSLAIDLCNEHDAIIEAQQITDLLREHFSQFPELAERVGDDASQLEKIATRRSFAELLKPIHTLCQEAAGSAERHPLDADNQGQRIITNAPGLLTVAERSGAPIDLINEAKDHIAFAICACAVECGNKTAKWRPCQVLLDAANIFAVGPQAKERVTKNLEIVRRNVRIYGGLEPIDSAPSLYTFNGCGVTLYGNTDHDRESGSYMATYYFVLIGIPIFPICRYRVIPTGANSYRFLGKGPLRVFDKWHIAISAFVILFAFMHK